jgi:hypothetical protein
MTLKGPAMTHLISASSLLLTAALAFSGPGGDQPKSNALTPKETADGWILLFDGATPFGWTIEGESKIENGEMLLGGQQKTVAKLTTLLGSFDLRLEFRVTAGPGVGIIRLYQGSTWLDVDMQCDSKAWHRFEDTIEVSPMGAINSQYKSIDLTTGAVKGSSTSLTGGSGAARLALVVPAGTKLALRNIKARPLGLNPIFDGKSLSGWKEVKTPKTKSQFTVTDKGELNVKNGPGDLQTQKQWDDFVLQIDVFSNGAHLNSGVFFRCLPGEFWSGYEAQIRNQWKGDDRTQAVDYGTGGIYNRQPARKVVSNDHEWFTMTVVAHGNHLSVWVNGFQTADFTDNRPADRSARKGSKTGAGPISLQGHDPTTDLSFRNIRIADLPKGKE